MKLYDYYRSSACYRVRIALNIKNINYESIEVHLLNNGGEQHATAYHALNPLDLVPTLEENGHILQQSIAIIEYLDEIAPNPPLFPHTPLARAKVRAIVNLISCDIHPINNLRVLNQLRSQFKSSDEDIQQWMHHWLHLGFDALEALINQSTTGQRYCYKDKLTLADICLIPQVFNAKRFEFDISTYPSIEAIYTHCTTLPPFMAAAPTPSSRTEHKS